MSDKQQQQQPVANKTMMADVGTSTTKPKEMTTTSSVTSTKNSIEFDDNDEDEDLDESGSSPEKTATTATPTSLVDSNEAQENVQSSVVLEPPDSSTETSSSPLPKEAEADADEDSDQLSRRVFSRNKLSPSAIGSELRKLKGNHKSLFAKQALKRKRAKKVKNTQTRQGTTTVGYGQLSSNYAANNPLTFPGSLRHNLPQQLSATVQKLLLMNKLSPQSSNLRAKQQPNQQQLLIDNSQNLHHLLSKNQAYPQHLSNNPRLTDLLNQWASSEDAPSYSPARAPPQPARNKMIPVEIIGLDPAVTNSILYGAGETAPMGAASMSSQSDPSGEQQHHLYTAQSAGGQAEEESEAAPFYPQLGPLLTANRGLHATHAKTLDGAGQPKASSILHIHHFHTQVKPATAPAAASGEQATRQTSAEEQREPAAIADGAGQQANRDNLVHMVHAQLGSSAQAQPAKSEHQQVYVNDKGQLVYLSVEDAGASGAGDSRPPSADQEQPAEGQKSEIEPQEAWPVDGSQPAGEQTSAQDYPSATEASPTEQQLPTAADQNQEHQSSDQHEVQLSTLNGTHGVPPGVFLVPTGLRATHNESEPKHQRAVYLTNSIGPSGGSLRASAQQSAADSEGAGEVRGQQPLLMVAYKPRSQLFRNLTSEDTVAGGSHRTPYNEGQESKPSLATHFLSSGPQQNSLFKGTSGLLLRPFADDNFQSDLSALRNRFRPNITELGGRLNNNQMVAGLTQLAQLHNEHAIRANFSNPFLQMPPRYQLQDNRVPSPPAMSPFFNPALKALLTAPDQIGLAGALANNSSFGGALSGRGELGGGIPNFWLEPLIGDKLPQLGPRYPGGVNVYLNSSAPAVNASAVLLRQLQQFKDKFLQQASPMRPISLNLGAQQVSGLTNSTKMTGEPLLSILQELGRNSSSSGHYLDQPLNITFSDSSVAVPSTAARPTAVASKPAAKQVATQAPTMKSSSTGSIKPANGFPTRTPVRPAEWPATPQPPLPPQIKRPPPVTQEPMDYDDANGLSNIALAFIFIVSLLTLTVIAASMIYKQKRRSMGRCSDLPARSARRLTRNLTKRTKHFTRSNFMNPGDINSMKSINLDSASLSTATKSPVSSGGGGGRGLDTDNQSNPRSETNRGGYITKKAFGQTLTTFNSSTTPLSEKYQFTTQSSIEDSAGDIKTLNTRLQKPSYLKSLISTPDCLLLGKKLQKQQLQQRADSSDGAYYLNTRQVSRGQQQQTAVKQVKSSQSPSDEHCVLASNKKLACESPKAYGSSKDSSLARERHEASVEPPGNSRKSIMSTIHSISDCEAKSAAELKKQQQTPGLQLAGSKWNKLNNFPAPKHLAASLSAHGLAYHEGRQVDKL